MEIDDFKAAAFPQPFLYLQKDSFYVYFLCAARNNEQIDCGSPYAGWQNPHF